MDIDERRTSKALPTDIPGKLERANQHKEEGNEFFKMNLYRKAISAYGKSLAYTRGLPGSARGLSGVGELANKANKDKSGNITNEEEAKFIEIETAVETNIATCYLKLLDYEKALEHANRALTLNATYWKAMLRKAEALIMSKNYERAREQLTEALKYTTDESWIAKIRKEEARIAMFEKEEGKKQRKAFAGVFEKAAKMDESS